MNVGRHVQSNILCSCLCIFFVYIVHMMDVPLATTTIHILHVVLCRLCGAFSCMLTPIIIASVHRWGPRCPLRGVPLYHFTSAWQNLLALLCTLCLPSQTSTASNEISGEATINTEILKEHALWLEHSTHLAWLCQPCQAKVKFTLVSVCDIMFITSRAVTLWPARLLIASSLPI